MALNATLHSAIEQRKTRTLEEVTTKLLDIKDHLADDLHKRIAEYAKVDMHTAMARFLLQPGSRKHFMQLLQRYGVKHPLEDPHSGDQQVAMQALITPAIEGTAKDLRRLASIGIDRLTSDLLQAADEVRKQMEDYLSFVGDTLYESYRAKRHMVEESSKIRIDQLEARFRQREGKLEGALARLRETSGTPGSLALPAPPSVPKDEFAALPTNQGTVELERKVAMYRMRTTEMGDTIAHLRKEINKLILSRDDLQRAVEAASDELQSMRTGHQQQLRELEERHSKELSDLEAKHSVEVEQLKEASLKARAARSAAEAALKKNDEICQLHGLLCDKLNLEVHYLLHHISGRSPQRARELEETIKVGQYTPGLSLPLAVQPPPSEHITTSPVVSLQQQIEGLKEAFHTDELKRRIKELEEELEEGRKREEGFEERWKAREAQFRESLRRVSVGYSNKISSLTQHIHRMQRAIHLKNERVQKRKTLTPSALEALSQRLCLKTHELNLAKLQLWQAAHRLPDTPPKDTSSHPPQPPGTSLLDPDPALLDPMWAEADSEVQRISRGQLSAAMRSLQSTPYSRPPSHPVRYHTPPFTSRMLKRPARRPGTTSPLPYDTMLRNGWGGVLPAEDCYTSPSPPRPDRQEVPEVHDPAVSADDITPILAELGEAVRLAEESREGWKGEIRK
eukprot:Sspe_Gene.27694::Locus_12055_Transcript_1_1_Confidence_1.000_Length_2144::g.27694::m.27694